MLKLVICMEDEQEQSKADACAWILTKVLWYKKDGSFHWKNRCKLEESRTEYIFKNKQQPNSLHHQLYPHTFMYEMYPMWQGWWDQVLQIGDQNQTRFSVGSELQKNINFPSSFVYINIWREMRLVVEPKYCMNCMLVEPTYICRLVLVLVSSFAC